jgi:hypothetical protein
MAAAAAVTSRAAASDQCWANKRAEIECEMEPPEHSEHADEDVIQIRVEQYERKFAT